MTKTLYIMQGIPGSGKSTVAKLIAHDYNDRSDKGVAVIASADDFWYLPENSPKGLYNYDPDRIGEAHKWCQQLVITLMQTSHGCIIVDNTNIKKWSVEPYKALAKIFGYDVQVVRVEVEVNVAIKRQHGRPEDRQIPEDVIRKMANEMERLI